MIATLLISGVPRDVALMYINIAEPEGPVRGSPVVTNHSGTATLRERYGIAIDFRTF